MNITDEAMTSVVAKAILDSLDADQRATLIQDALKHMIEPTEVERNYRKEKGPSRLQTAFRQQLEFVAGQVIREQLQESHVRDEIRVFVEKALTEALAVEGKASVAMAEVLTETMSRAMRNY